MWKWVVQSCPTLCNYMDYTVHGILQARKLEWEDVPFSRGSSQPRDGTQHCRWFFTSWATREALVMKEKNLQPRDYSTQKDLIQIQQRNQKLYRQANAKRIQLIQMNLFIKQISKSTDFKNHTYGYQRGNVGD